MAFDGELGSCLAEIVGETPPPVEGDALLFCRQWLGGRNLGLVPIANAAAFQWPGMWLARVHTADGDHAVVMFGAPSGAWFDPASGPIRVGDEIVSLD